MKYLCLIYGDPEVWEAKGQGEVDGLVRDHFDYDDALRRGGQMITAQALEPPATATMVRMRDGKISATDGPFAETKEELGGFYLIEARDLDEAIKVAGNIPSARWGSIEVRPVKTLVRP
ncbi:MAG: YciI family protein [Bauldia sp.]